MDLIATVRAKDKPDISPAIILAHRFGISIELAALIAELANIGQRQEVRL